MTSHDEVAAFDAQAEVERKARYSSPAAQELCDLWKDERATYRISLLWPDLARKIETLRATELTRGWSHASNEELAMAWELGVLDGQLAEGRRRIIPNPYRSEP